MAQTCKFRKGKSLFSTTLSTGIGTGTSDTITPASVAGLPTDTEITLTIDRVDANGVSTPTKMERITGTISGGNLTSYTRAIDGSTEQAHSAGAVIEYIFNADDLNDIVDGILVEHNQDGTHKAALVTTLKAAGSDITTGTNDTKIVTPKAVADAGFVRDTDGTLAANSDTKLATQKATKTYVDAHSTGIDAWNASADTWVYVSPSTFKIVGVNRTSIYTKGTRLRFKQGAGYKYADVFSSSFSTDTTITIPVNTDHTIANAAITDNYYSYAANPQGYPGAFNFTPVITNAGGSWTNPPTVNDATYSIIGNIAIIKIHWTYANPSGGSGTTYFSIPITPAYAYQSGASTNPSSGKALSCCTNSTNPQVDVNLYDGTTAIASNNQCSLVIPIQF